MLKLCSTEDNIMTEDSSPEECERCYWNELVHFHMYAAKRQLGTDLRCKGFVQLEEVNVIDGEASHLDRNCRANAHHSWVNTNSSKAAEDTQNGQVALESLPPCHQQHSCSSISDLQQGHTFANETGALVLIVSCMAFHISSKLAVKRDFSRCLVQILHKSWLRMHPRLLRQTVYFCDALLLMHE